MLLRFARWTGGIVAGEFGYEAGQSGVGDIFAWFLDHAVPAGGYFLAPPYCAVPVPALRP